MTSSKAHATTDAMRDVLSRAATIAVVGYSAKPDRPSHQIATYLRAAGYRVIPVNPALAGQTIEGETAYATVQDIPDAVDVVDVFRPSDALPAVVDDAIAAGAPVVWAQLGIASDAAAARAEAAGVTLFQDACIKVEHARLGIPRK